MAKGRSTTHRRVIILGSSGSIGVNTLHVLRHLAGLTGPDNQHFELVGLAVGQSGEILELQAAEFNVTDVAIADPAQATHISTDRRIRTGKDSASELVRDIAQPGDLVVAAMVGACGIPAVLTAIELGCDIALANKETLVAAGSLVRASAKSSAVRIIPIDSEHSAIFQALYAGNHPSETKRIVLTASGGPFRTWDADRIQSATAAEALNHPTWSMGPKVTIDSATLMNKALELIEAHWLFEVPSKQLDAVIHPTSIVHSFVEFIDGSVIAQLSPPDMRMPIQLALTWPQRMIGSSPTLDFQNLGELTFEPVDPTRFPAIQLAREVIDAAGTAGAILNAANEVAVEAFLAGSIRFGKITDIARNAFDSIPVTPADSLEAIQAADEDTRRHVKSQLHSFS